MISRERPPTSGVAASFSTAALSVKYLAATEALKRMLKFDAMKAVTEVLSEALAEEGFGLGSGRAASRLRAGSAAGGSADAIDGAVDGLGPLCGRGGVRGDNDDLDLRLPLV